MLTLSNADLAVVRSVVAEMVADGHTNSVGGASCGVTCEELSIQLGWSMTYGSIRDSQGALIDDDHAWLVAPDGTVVDPTIQQFEGRVAEWPGYGDIAVIPPGHSMHAQYGEVHANVCAASHINFSM